jgi:hypothetical protein
MNLLGFASFNLDPGLPAIDFELTSLGNAAAPTGFRVDLTLGDRLKLPELIRPATVTEADGKQTLTPAAAGPVVVSGLVALRTEGSATQAAGTRFVIPGTDEAVVTVALKPSTVLFGDSGFGLDFAGGLVVDNSSTEAPAPAPGVPVGPEGTPSWQGITVRNAKFYFPPTTPLLGSRPLDVAFALGSPVGIDARCSAELLADGDKPRVVADFEWHDPAADSLAMCLPTLITATVEFAVQGQTANLPDGAAPGAVPLEGVEKLTVRGRFARDLRTAPPTLSFSLGVDRSGPDGLIAVRANPGFGPATVFVTAGALAAAFMADADRHDAPSGDASGSTLHALLVAASGLSAALADRGKLVVHGVEILGVAGPAAKSLVFRVDYSVDVVVKTIGVGTLSVGMNPAVPMRVRYRNVRLEIDFTKSGLDRFNLSYAEADYGVEDPGQWLVNSPGSLLDILGTRSGHGSTWFEIDLRFALDLGPIKVSGATVRATFNGGPTPAVTLRGLDASVNLPGLISASGYAQLQQAGFDAALAATLIPLQIGALGMISLEDGGGFKKVLLNFAVDLPGPIPLLNSGLGIFGFQGVFGVNCAPKDISAEPDPATALLGWKPWAPQAMPPRRGELTIGLGVSVGTVPDLGFAFSSKALVVVAVPDLAIRASLEGRILSERVKLADLDGPPPPGPRLLGALAVDSGGVTIGMRGEFAIDPLFKVLIPFGAHFPTVGNDWYVHLGSDGAGSPVRGPGPISAQVLPDLLDCGASVYLMVRGNGIDDFAHLKTDFGGFFVGFGFDWRQSLGFSIVSLELHADLAVGLGSNPLMFIGHGELDGSLHLGPVSLGVSAGVDLQVGPGDVRWAYIHVCGEVDLFFFSLSGCADLTVGHKTSTVPPPAEWPLKQVRLSDRFYGDAVDAGASADSAPTVWPDTIPLLEFAHGPACELADGPFADKLTAIVAGKRAWNSAKAGNGSFGSGDLSYTFFLTKLNLVEVADAGETPVANGQWASWLVPKHVSGDRPGARELALLTWQPHLWTKILPDGGKSLTPDPLGGVANHCHVDLVAVPWWALGRTATRVGDGWDLPPEESFDRRFASVFQVGLTVAFNGQPLTAAGVYNSPQPIAFDLGGTETFASPVSGGGHRFTGALRLPRAIHRMANWDMDPAGAQLRAGAVADMRFSTAVSSPLIAALFDLWNQDTHPVAVIGRRADGATEALTPMLIPGPGGKVIVVFGSGGGGFVSALLRYDARLLVELLGVRGETEEAKTVVDQTGQASAAGSANLGSAAGTLGGGESLLKPGTLYRLDVGQRALGTLRDGTNDSFSANPVSYWFRTSPMPPTPHGPPPVGTALPPSAEIFRVRAWNSGPIIRRDTFDPAYLQRYLLGFTPVDRTQNWFCDDAVAAHFKVEYIEAFAKLYGRDVELHCLRTDTPPGRPGAVSIFTAAALVKSTAPRLASAADLRLALRDVPPPGDCPLPGSAGATLPGKPPLEPRGAYDLAVFFPQPSSPGSGNQLPGIIFSTSRWRNPQELLRGLGFVSAFVTVTPALGDGDLPVTAVSFPPGKVVGDLALETALSQLGLARWPAPPEDALRSVEILGQPAGQVPAGRTSLLWVKTAGQWRLAGVFLEAAEPIDRPAAGPDNTARLVVVNLSHAGAPFATRVQDAGGSRLLFLTSSPLTPSQPLVLEVDEQAVPVDAPTTPVRRSVWLNVGSAPRFTEDSL